MTGDARSLPQDVLAEQSVIGGLMLSARAVDEVAEILQAADFYRPAHETIYAAITDLYGRGEPCDAVTVMGVLRTSGDLERVGGAAYLHTLVHNVPTAANASYYARIVREHAGNRRLTEAGTRIAQIGFSGGEAAENLATAQAELLAVAGAHDSLETEPLSDLIEAAFESIEAAGRHEGGTAGVPTGFIDLDRLTNGLHPGQFVVIAARPAIGKSTLALDICRSAAIRHAMPTAMFSLEMSKNEITTRMLSAEARVFLQKMRQGELDEGDWGRLAQTMGSVSDAPLLIDDSPSLNMVEIRSRCRRLHQRHGLRLVVVDYLQLLSSGKKTESRQVEVSEFSRALKLLAKELNVPVIALSQLNRGPEQRVDKKPMLSDLRESGSLEQDSDMVILLHREDAYDKESPRAGEADFIVAKHRNGPTDTITVAFQGQYSRFVDMASGPAPAWTPHEAMGRAS